MVILGIDPGLRATGWGAIAATGSMLSFVAAGTIRSAAGDALALRLAAIYEGLCQVLATVDPQEAAVEQTFVSKDGAATLKLGQARGVALLAPAARGLAVAEYAPTLVKKAVVGAGRADKSQMRFMVSRLLPKATGDSEHAFDALGVAICHASHRRAHRIAA